MKLVGGNLSEGFNGGGIGLWHEVRFGFSGEKSLDYLGHVAFLGIDGVRKILGVVGGGKARPSGIVSRFDILEPDGIDRKACRRVVELEKGLNTGQVIGTEVFCGSALCIVRDCWCVISGKH